MQRFNRQAFHQFIINNGVIGFFDEPVKLKSGRASNWYVNWRSITSDVFLTNKLSDFIIDFITDLKVHTDGFFGVPEGATKLAVITTYKWAKNQPNFDKGSHALSMGRAKPKEHGAPKDRYFVGEPRGKVIILEDVTTTGYSLIDTIDKVKSSGATVIAALSLTDRMELTDERKTVSQIVAEAGVEYQTMSRATDLLPEACKIIKPDAKIIKSIEEEFTKFGARAIKLEGS